MELSGSAHLHFTKYFYDLFSINCHMSKVTKLIEQNWNICLCLLVCLLVCLCINVCIFPSICLCLSPCKKFWKVGRNIWNSIGRGGGSMAALLLPVQYFFKICNFFKLELVDMNLFAFQRCTFAIQRIHKFNWDTFFCNTNHIPSSQRPTNHLWRKNLAFFIGYFEGFSSSSDFNI